MSNMPEIIVETAKNPEYAVIWLHGLGADGNDFAPFVKELTLPKNLAIRFIFPHAPVQPVTLMLGMPTRAWYDILDLDKNSNQDEAGIRKSELLVQQLIEQQVAQGISCDKIFIGGFSQGGAMALHTALRYPEKLAGIIAISTYLPLADLVEAERHAANHDTPIFLAHGKLDPVIPLEFAEISHKALVELKHKVDWLLYPIAHTVCAEELDHLSNWIIEHTKV